MAALAAAAMLCACGYATEPKDDGVLSKSEAQALLEAADDAEEYEDICDENGFNGDGVCDEWCPDGDTSDCPVSDACEDGDTKPAPDGCNTCSCSDGAWVCTEIACGSGPTDPDACVDGDTEPAGDGCNTCTCADGLWACTEMACNEPNDELLILQVGGCEELPDDPVDVSAASVAEDVLRVEIGHSSGCAQHVYEACWDGYFLESYPVQAGIMISHDANGEMCEAYEMRTLEIDLAAMRAAYANGYGSTEGETIILRVEGQTANYDL